MKQVYGIGMGYLVLLIITGFIFVSNRFYQVNVDHLDTPYASMSCIYSQGAPNDSYDWDQIWLQTENRLAAGDSVVLWSEEAVRIDEADEDTLLAQASALSSRYNNGFIGVTYQKSLSDGMATNQFALISPDGAVAWNYHKALPVPFIESSIIPGKKDLQYYDPMEGPLSGIRLSGSICFDMDFPSYIQQASFKHIDLMLQPSWTWNALDRRHFEGDAMRAIGKSILRNIRLIIR